ncbi:MAG: chromosomal replication initiator protein DnaA [Saprospiraceae bacterium]|nr:chromosomal replication initiator protein DnaA [Saprospiraceae bacterium]
MLYMHQLVWDKCLTAIRDAIPEQSFKTWFEPVKPIRLEDNVLTIQVPNKFFYEWIEEHYLEILKKSIKHELGKQGRLEYFIPMEKQTRSSAGDASFPKSIDTNQLVNPFVIPGIRKVKFESNLHPDYRISNYVEGDCNKLPRAAGIAIAKRPGKTGFNPLYVYGAVGLGKTHLIQAIGNEILANHPDKGVLYLSSEKFTQQVIHPIKNNAIDDFMAFFQHLDVLIIDDIQFLANRTKTQEIFFHIFNQMHQIGKQIIISSDKPPKDLQDIEERLVSRFKWGLHADLVSPDFETRMAILEAKSQDEEITIPYNVQELICHNIKNSIRELEGVLISLAAQASLNQKQIDLTLAKEVIEKFVKNYSKEISLEKIQKMVAEHFKIKEEFLQSKTRKRSIVIARQLSMYLAKNLTSYSLAKIGGTFGGRDHSTVIYSVKTIKDLLDTDDTFRISVEELEKKIKLSLAV